MILVYDSTSIGSLVVDLLAWGSGVRSPIEANQKYQIGSFIKLLCLINARHIQGNSTQKLDDPLSVSCDQVG